jgi:hypothetical protein
MLLLSAASRQPQLSTSFDKLKKIVISTRWAEIAPLNALKNIEKRIDLSMRIQKDDEERKILLFDEESAGTTQPKKASRQSILKFLFMDLLKQLEAD